MNENASVRNPFARLPCVAFLLVETDSWMTVISGIVEWSRC
jgi:hypothetical protein